MILIHDPAVKDSIRARVQTLTGSTPARWGKMSSGQMLWHCNQVMKTSLGEINVVHRRPPFPVPMIKFILFNMPWPHNAPTAPEYQVAGTPHDFETERKNCLELIDRFTSRSMDESGWSRAVFGTMNGREWSCLHARHLDHHLKQFNV